MQAVCGRSLLLPGRSAWPTACARTSDRLSKTHRRQLNVQGTPPGTISGHHTCLHWCLRSTAGMLQPRCGGKHASSNIGMRLRSVSRQVAWRRCHSTQPLRARPTPLPTPPAAAAPQTLSVDSPDFTKMMFDRVDQQSATKQAGGAGGSTTYQAFLAADKAWSAVRNMPTGIAAGPAPEFVRSSGRTISATATTSSPVFDVCVCGGTLGIFLAAALAQKGWKVAVVERGVVAGRRQEWNISRKELDEMVELGLLAPSDLAEVIAMEFNPVRVGFNGGKDVWTQDVLNLGVRPDLLIAKMVKKFEQFGGKIFQRVTLDGVEVSPSAVQLNISSNAAAEPPSNASSSSTTPSSSSSSSSSSSGQGEGIREYPNIRCRLLLDCMGHASPIVRQLRWGHKPDGVCLVVGGCARGFDPDANATADIIYTNADLQPAGSSSSSSGKGGSKKGSTQGQPLQYFWEAFPAADGLLDGSSSTESSSSSSSNGPGFRSDARTTYMFTYCDAQSWRPSLADVMSDYWTLMPQYQGLEKGLEGLNFTRLLFGFFPTYTDSPLRSGFDRVLQVGDASGIQSPLSFGGFGALTRHLPRLLSALDEALAADALQQSDLALVNPYNPGLSSAWMLQRAMTATRSPGRSADPRLINKMLAGNFASMESLGDPVMKPFLQDVIQFQPLLQTMAAQVVAEPGFVPKLMGHVGLVPLMGWLGHVAALGAYTALDAAAAPTLGTIAKGMDKSSRYKVHRWLDAWKYGSGRDFKL